MTYPSEVWPVDLTESRDVMDGGAFEGRFFGAGDALPMRRHMLDTFYRSAPIPRATGLARLAGDNNSYLEEEIGMVRLLTFMMMLQLMLSDLQVACCLQD